MKTALQNTQDIMRAKLFKVAWRSIKHVAMAFSVLLSLALPFSLATGIAYAQSNAAPAFLEGSEDIPLMEGLVPVPDTGLVFDSPAGRIIESFAAGPLNRRGVIEFYGETLPALGWAAQSQVIFFREGERLELDFFGPNGTLTVRFTLAPN